MKDISRFIVFEGLDGSGKSTQTKLLVQHLKQEGYKVAQIDFPQYGKKSAGLIEEYLNGKYGSAASVGPYRPSIFYACDRYAASFKIKKWLHEGKIVISDRYVASNIGYQGSKIKNRKESEKFIKWENDLEYNIFKIPKPDITFILQTSPALSRKMAPQITDKTKKKKRATYLRNKKRDIHEKDLEYLRRTLRTYLQIAKNSPREYKVIECVENNRLLSPQEIHGRIWEIARKIV